MLCPSSAFLSVHSFQILLVVSFISLYTYYGGGTFVLPRIILACFVLFGYLYLFLYLIRVFNNIFLPIFNSLSMNIRFSLLFLTHSLTAMVLQHPLLYIIICHAAYFSSNSPSFSSILIRYAFFKSIYFYNYNTIYIS